jgi:CheY-like chemotaxis protein
MAVILVVDDESFLRTVAATVLTPNGHLVLEAASGKEALSICEKTAVDLVISDLWMPEMDGFELISSLRESHNELPILAISGVFSGEFLRNVRLLGPTETLEKPFTGEQLLGMVNKLLGEGK